MTKQQLIRRQCLGGLLRAWRNQREQCFGCLRTSDLKKQLLKQYRLDNKSKPSWEKPIKMLRLRKSKLLPQQVSDLGAFIFVVAMIPVSKVRSLWVENWEQINVNIGFHIFQISHLGDLPLGSDRCQPCTISRTATGKRLEEVLKIGK